MIIYLDTETTGLYPGEICQLSYVMQDQKSAKAKNFFFSVEYVEYGAQCVHGLSKEVLDKLSNGKGFNCFAEEIEKDFLSANIVVCHNASFDMMFLEKEFFRMQKDLPVQKSFCSMKKLTPVCKISRRNNAGYKYPKLTEMCEFFGVKDGEILREAQKLFGDSNLFHDARFDTTALYLCMKKGMNEIECLRELKENL